MRLYAIAALVALIAGLPVSASAGQTFFGMAAYYSGRGSGLTAAHKTLPFGTRVRVTDPKTGRSVVVTIAGSSRMISVAVCNSASLTPPRLSTSGCHAKRLPQQGNCFFRLRNGHKVSGGFHIAHEPPPSKHEAQRDDTVRRTRSSIRRNSAARPPPARHTINQGGGEPFRCALACVTGTDIRYRTELQKLSNMLARVFRLWGV
jgi:hypothetical protein